MTSHLTNLELPSSLKKQLGDFRSHLWIVKSLEGLSIAVFAILVAFLTLFTLDRLVETPAWTRLLLFCIALLGGAVIPVYVIRWIWSRRRFDQLARLLRRRHPSIGDQMLGIIELVRSESEQARSQALCQAAIKQVAEDATHRDFRDAVPKPRHRLFATIAAVPLGLALLLAVLFPLAVQNAAARFLAPWSTIPRYTFTSLEALPDRLVVPHGEEFTLSVVLSPDSRWQPQRATARLANQPAVESTLGSSKFTFTFPAQIEPGSLRLTVGDARHRMHIEPIHRPELSSIVANVTLPAYLERREPLQKDVRSGSVTVLSGSSVQFQLTTNRLLSSAMLDNVVIPTTGMSANTTATTIEVAGKRVFAWKDEFGLTGQQPFNLAIESMADEAPSISCDDLPRQRVILDSETLSFHARAQDDYGVKIVGMEWKGTDSTAVITIAKGEQTLAAGGSEKEVLDIAGAFCAKTLNIAPQPISLRLFVEDYRPGRARVYSSPYVFYVLSPEQHAIWIAEQLSKWHRQSLEVRDREMQLHHTNQQMRMLTPEELDKPETRRQIEAQATAERANGRHLTGLVTSGEDLVRQAMRNPDIGVGHLDKWADMLRILRDISAHRMPTVADLLKESAQAPTQLAQSDSKNAPTAGKIQNAQGSPNQSKEPTPAQPAKPPVPTVVDAESSQASPDKKEQPADDGKKNPSSPRLTLPVTTVPGSPPPPSNAPAPQKLEEAVVAQQNLLAEFEKVTDELNKVLGNLEGSTLTKRLKAASRQQYLIAGKINDHISKTFGKPKFSAPAEDIKVLESLTTMEHASAENVSHIMDDLQAFLERRRLQRFKTVLEELQQQETVASLRQLGDDIPSQTGMSIAQCEFWSDTFDRWADNLVDPACSGKCPGSKSKGSLPPSVVLEAMKILEAEVNLREETRVAQQARPASAQDAHETRAFSLKRTQSELKERVGKLAERISELPDGEMEFAKELKLLAAVENVMTDAVDILGSFETGAPAIAAETEAIELLLQSKKINPRGGGGGGSSPGGGGTGTTNDSALALIGSGINDKEVREDHGIAQSTGDSGSTLPEEFRAGLDQYFNRLEREEKPK